MKAGDSGRQKKPEITESGNGRPQGSSSNDIWRRTADERGRSARKSRERISDSESHSSSNRSDDNIRPDESASNRSDQSTGQGSTGSEYTTVEEPVDSHTQKAIKEHLEKNRADVLSSFSANYDYSNLRPVQDVTKDIIGNMEKTRSLRQLIMLSRSPSDVPNGGRNFGPGDRIPSISPDPTETQSSSRGASEVSETSGKKSAISGTSGKNSEVSGASGEDSEVSRTSDGTKIIRWLQNIDERKEK